MVVVLWSAKGGSGTTVTAVGLAAAVRRRRDVLLVDLDGDLAWAAGCPEPSLGVSDWLAAGDSVALDSWSRLEVDTPLPGVQLLGWGGAQEWPGDRVDTLVGLLRLDPRLVIVDLGTVDRAGAQQSDLQRRVVAQADHSVSVTRGCALGMRRLLQSPHQRHGLVVVREHGHPLEIADLEHLTGVPVVARLDVDPLVTRLVDQGRLAQRPPRSFTSRLTSVVP